MALNFKQSETRSHAGILLAVLLVASLVLVTVYAREGASGPLHAVQSATSGLFGPLKTAGGALGAAEVQAARAVADATADPDSLTALREQDEALRQTIAQLEEYRQEALRLEGLLGLRDRYGATGVACRVTARSTDTWNQVVTIDAGTAQGVRAGLPVLGATGLLGQVIAVSPGSADVRLLSDPQTGVAAMIQSSRAEGILRGSYDGLMYLEDVDSSIDVQPGDVVLTSGLGGGFYRGMMMGTVVKVDGEVGDDNRRIIVDLNVSADPLEEVFVVTGVDASSAADAPDDDAQDGPSVSDRPADDAGDADDPASAQDALAGAPEDGAEGGDAA